MMLNAGEKPTVDVYSSLFVACGKKSRWSDVIDVFEKMPKVQLSHLNGGALSLVIMAHSKSKSEEIILRGLDIFGVHRDKWGLFPCNAALEGLLRTHQFDVLLALANEMKRHDIKWNSFVYKTVALAYIRNGSVETARQFVHANAKHLRSDDAECYRELIDYYANTGGDTKAACQIYLEMIQNKIQLRFSDWSNALELALQFPDHTVYWSIRNHMSLEVGSIEKDLPAHLLLPKPDDPKRKQNSYPDVALVLKIFHDIQEAGGVGLTENMASKLMSAVAQLNRADDCVTMWRYFEKQGVFPKTFARVAAFNTLSNARKYESSLEMFQTLLNGDAPPSAWAYTKALECAIKTKRYSLVTETLRHLREHDVKMTMNDYTNIITSCIRTNEWALSLSMVSAMKSQGLQPTSSTFNLLLAGCGKDNFWNMVIEVYNGMEETRRSQLDGKALGAVLMAFSRADSDELQSRTTEIYKRHISCKPFPFEAAMMALFEAKQFTDVFSVAADATRQGFEWTPLVHRTVVMANIRSGSMEEARKLLDENVKRMNGTSVRCYRELIRYYAEVRGNAFEASELSLQMMQNNGEVTADDWRTALELALQIPDRAIYWELRKWLRLHGEIPLCEFREHLLLPDDQQLQHQQDSAAGAQ